MDGCLQPFCAPRTLPSPQTRRARPGTHAHRQQMDGEDGVGHRRATLPRPLPPAPASGPPPTVLTVFAKDRRPEAVLAEEVEGPARAAEAWRGRGAARRWPRWGQAATGTWGPPGGSRVGSAWARPPLDLRGRTSSLYAIGPQPHPGTRGQAAPASPSAHGSISTLRAEAGSWGPAPRPPEAGGAGSKCLTLRPPADPSSIRDAAAGAPTLALRTPAPHRRAPSTLERWDPRGGAGCPQAQAGAMRCPLHFCQCLTSWRPTLGCPTAGGCPLCTLTPWRRGARHRDQEGWWKCTRPPGGKALREAGWRGPHRLRGLH